jgi:hypothetical protein
MDGTEKCKLPSMPPSTGLCRIQHFNTKIELKETNRRLLLLTNHILNLIKILPDSASLNFAYILHDSCLIFTFLRYYGDFFQYSKQPVAWGKYSAINKNRGNQIPTTENGIFTNILYHFQFQINLTCMVYFRDYLKVHFLSSS